MIETQVLIASELEIKNWQVENALKLRAEGGTIPFIARYRKEKTGTLDENQLRLIFERQDYLDELDKRKETILKTISEQGKLTEDLKKKIENCLSKTELEDLYLPYKPKKRTRATAAREKGLEPLAQFIKEHNIPESPETDLEGEARKYIDPEKKVENAADALAGASDILAEELAEKAELRAWVRESLVKHGEFVSHINDDFEAGSTKYEMYRDFSVPVRKIAPHNMLALRRGEKEGVINFDLKFEEEDFLLYLEKKSIFTQYHELALFLKTMVKDAFNRLMKNSIIGEIRADKKAWADEQSINVFESNLRQMLLAAPAGMKPTLGIDPGFRTGCKIAALDETGKLLAFETIYPEKSAAERSLAAETVRRMINDYKIELIAIGNGTASRETDRFVEETLSGMSKTPIKVMVSEAGASVYSASKVANEEFPELDLSIRGAISIARRLQDPLAELVKIDPKSIGVGQYQHDVDQKLLKKKLEETVESSVNYVGVDVNTASKELLTYVSGLSSGVAKNIVRWRDQNGVYESRKQLLKVPKFGPKAFEQAAGFLRIRGGKNVLDNTAVHPESYWVVERFAKDLQVPLAEITRHFNRIKKLNFQDYVTEEIGVPTLVDIVRELEKPGRDPRDTFQYAKFMDGIKDIADLREGMILEGVVTNITNFGAFVDVGVHQDGLVHISEISNSFVKDPAMYLKVGEVINVMVMNVDIDLNRIALSIKRVTD